MSGWLWGIVTVARMCLMVLKVPGGARASLVGHVSPTPCPTMDGPEDIAPTWLWFALPPQTRVACLGLSFPPVCEAVGLGGPELPSSCVPSSRTLRQACSCWVVAVGSSVVGVEVLGSQAWPGGRAGSAGLGPALGSGVLTTWPTGLGMHLLGRAQ